MLIDIFRELRMVAVDLRGEAERRRHVTQLDRVADTMAHCAAVFEARIALLEGGLEWLTCEEYAEDVGTSPQTIRAWCRNNELEAEATPNGWRIRRGTTRSKKGRAA